MRWWLDRPTLLACLGVVAVCLPPLLPMLDGHFWGADDWVYLEEASLLAMRDPIGAAWRHFELHRPGEIQAGLRHTSLLFWALDLLVWGPNPAGFYLTNVLLLLGTGVLVCLLLQRWTGSALAAFAGACVFVLNARTVEVGWYLATRTETLALLFSTAVFLLWTREPPGPRSRRMTILCTALFTLGVFAKSTAGFLGLVLLAWEAGHLSMRELLAPRRLLKTYGPFAAVLAVYLGLVLLGKVLGGAVAFVPPPRGGLATAVGALPGQIGSALLAPRSQLGVPAASNQFELLVMIRAVLLTACVGVALIWRPTRTAVARLAVVWFVAGMILPLPMLLGGADFGRYFLVSAVGFVLLVAAPVGALMAHPSPRRKAAAWALAVALAGSSLALLVWDGTARYTAQRGALVGRFIDTLRTRVAEGPPFIRLHLAMHGPHRELLVLLQRRAALHLLVPGLAIEECTFWFSGSDRAFEFPFVAYDFQLPGVNHITERKRRIDVRQVATNPNNAVLAADADARGISFRAVAYADLAPRKETAPEARVWSFRGGETHGWRFHREGRPWPNPIEGPDGLVLPPIATMTASMLEFLPGIQLELIRSPALDLDPGAWCDLQVDYLGRPHDMGAPERDAPFLYFDHYSVMQVQGGDGLPPRLGRSLYARIEPVDGAPERWRSTFSLDTSPAWLMQDRITSFDLAPLNLADVRVERVELLPCRPTPKGLAP